MIQDELGNRIKRYEKVSQYKLLPRSPLFIRIDGRAFHTFTKGLERPFSQLLIDAMVYAATQTAKEMSGFKLAYVQSDEATFMLTDYSDVEDNYNTNGWFDYELNKIVSISASAFTAHFNWYWHIRGDMPNSTAMFDSRAFTVPIEDAPNVFVWRQKDWVRNSVQMYARHYFSQSELDGKKIPDIHEMLYQKGVNWSKLPLQLKNGTFITSDSEKHYVYATYYEVTCMLRGDRNADKSKETEEK